jgi:hypothetical protein
VAFRPPSLAVPYDAATQVPSFQLDAFTTRRFAGILQP